jgi:Leucine-rich repeat (LRR) protein
MDYENITELDLSNKGLNELPDLSKYTNLIKLDCYYNNIVALDNLPPGLQKLDCQGNAIAR